MKRNPGDIGCTCYRLRQAARLVSRTYDQFLAPCGISIGQFGMLVTLTAMEGESISKLAETLQMERTTLTRNLLPLQKLGYVAIEPGPDKRARALRLTETGKAALVAAQPLWQVAQRSLEHQLGKAEVKSLNAVLEDTLDRMSAHDEGLRTALTQRKDLIDE
jgi:DNA-binding MarR family transcriptional regulator